MRTRSPAGRFVYLFHALPVCLARSRQQRAVCDGSDWARDPVQVPAADSPSPHDEPERLQVAVVRGPQGRRHPVLVRGVQLPPCGLLQRVQVAVPGRPVVPLGHGGVLGSARLTPGSGPWGFWGGSAFGPGSGVSGQPEGEELTGWLLGDADEACGGGAITTGHAPFNTPQKMNRRGKKRKEQVAFSCFFSTPQQFGGKYSSQTCSSSSIHRSKGI